MKHITTLCGQNAEFLNIRMRSGRPIYRCHLALKGNVTDFCVIDEMASKDDRTVQEPLFFQVCYKKISSLHLATQKLQSPNYITGL